LNLYFFLAPEVERNARLLALDDRYYIVCPLMRLTSLFGNMPLDEELDSLALEEC
jgi:hypothetical protein